MRNVKRVIKIKMSLEDSESKDRAILVKAVKERDVYFLTRWYFDTVLTPLQTDLVRRIVFEEHKKFNISAMTRWGKSMCVSIAIALYLILNKNKTIFFVAPTQEQSMILRDYLAGFIRSCPALKEITAMSVSGDDKLTAQASRAYQTFTNGNKYRVFTAHNTADTLMGHGLGTHGGILIIDEACQISNDAYGKILRMLGDNPAESMLIELFNPWTRDSKAFDHSTDEDYYRMHVGWEEGVREGRTTQEYIDSMRKEITPLEFTVLYDSKFPLEGEDSIFNLAKIRESYIKSITKGTFVIGCDVSDKGLDHTVIYTGYVNNNLYSVNGVFSEPKSESVQIVGRLKSIVDEHKGEQTVVNIDCIGLGTGVVSAMKEYCEDMSNVTVQGCHFGEKAINPRRFLNKKAENYFRLKELFDSNAIRLPENSMIIKQLIQMTWAFTSSGKIKVIDPERPDDFADALVYFTWFDKNKANIYYAEDNEEKKKDEDFEEKKKRLFETYKDSDDKW